MDNDIGAKLREILGDPDAMKKVMGVAETIMGGQNPPFTAAGAKKQPPDDTPPSGNASAPPRGIPFRGGDENGIRLISALCPYLNPSRREAATSMIRILKILALIDLQKMKEE